MGLEILENRPLINESLQPLCYALCDPTANSWMVCSNLLDNILLVFWLYSRTFFSLGGQLDDLESSVRDPSIPFAFRIISLLGSSKCF